VSTIGEVRRDSLGLFVHLGEAGQAAVQSSRGAALELVGELIEDARVYARRRPDFEQNRMRSLVASRRDLEAVSTLSAGKWVIRADRASDIRSAITLAQKERLQLVIAGGAEAWQVAGELVRARVPVILEPIDNLPSTFDRIGARLDNAALLARAGVRVLISTMSEPHMVRTLRQEAGNAVAWGMPWAEAVRAISANVAVTFGLDGGTIEPGRLADLVLWSGDPLELASRPLAMWIGGRQVPLESRQTRLLEKYRKP
jgi:hypothetical protein